MQQEEAEEEMEELEEEVYYSEEGHQELHCLKGYKESTPHLHSLPSPPLPTLPFPCLLGQAYHLEKSHQDDGRLSEMDFLQYGKRGGFMEGVDEAVNL